MISNLIYIFICIVDFNYANVHQLLAMCFKNCKRKVYEMLILNIFFILFLMESK